jgi:hypothetical protein
MLAGHGAEVDGAGEWIERYAPKYSRRVITNFDEQRPDALLSYQRLVAKTYERTVIQEFHGTIQAEYIDQCCSSIRNLPRFWGYPYGT